MGYTISTRIEPLAQIFHKNGWDIPIGLVRSQTFPYIAFKQFNEGVVWATVNWDRTTSFAKVTFRWDDTIDSTKSNTVITRLKSMYG